MPKVSSPQTRAFRDERKFRPELHGIRGLAIFLVVAFHIFADGRVSGGIDVFLAVTGFLALPSLLRRTYGGWRIDLATRFSGLFRRLFIPLLPVLIAVGIAGFFVFPLSEQPQLFSEVRASALFYENWQLISSQLTYDAAGPSTSPLQHIWSTSIQGQFHVAMTFLVMAVAWLALKLRFSARDSLITILALLTAVSFTWAIYETGTNQDVAYFSTFSRAWELTLPGILGLVVPRFRLSPAVRAIMSWLGLGLIVSCGFVLDGAREFPGPTALWPVLGVCLFLTAGNSRTRWGADNLVVTKPFQKIGDISFSLYLWHWPILIFTLLLTGREQADLSTAAVVLGLSLLAGALGKYLFEDRAADWRPAFPEPRRAMATALTITSLSFIGASGVQAVSETSFAAEVAAYEEMVVTTDYPGAGVMFAPEGVTINPLEPVPGNDILRADAGWYTKVNKVQPCIQRHDSTDITPCQHPQADKGPLVVMVGSSHTGQWSDPIGKLAVEHGWDLELYEKSGCLFTTDGEENRSGLEISPSCVEWNTKILAELKERRPALIITTGSTRLAGDPESTTDGMVEAVERMTNAGIPVFLFRENPHETEDWITCLAEGADSEHTQCESPRDRFYSEEIDRYGFPHESESAFGFDTSAYLCDAQDCFAKVGNVHVLRDDNHITATFASSALPFISDGIREVAPDLFTDGSDVHESSVAR